MTLKLKLTQARLIELILSEGAMSRSEMSRRLGISASMITEMTAELIEQGILCECGYRNTHGKGRRNQLLDVDTSCGFALGAGLYERTLSVGLCTMKGETLSHRIITLPEDMSEEYIVEQGITAGKEILSDCCVPVEKLLGIGLCLKRSDLRRLGLPETSPHLPGIPESLPVLIEPADRILAYSDTYMPVNPDSLYLFGCGRAVREAVARR